MSGRSQSDPPAGPRLRVCPGKVEFVLVGWVKPTGVRPSRWVSPTLHRSNPASGTDSNSFPALKIVNGDRKYSPNLFFRLDQANCPRRKAWSGKRFQKIFPILTTGWAKLYWRPGKTVPRNAMKCQPEQQSAMGDVTSRAECAAAISPSPAASPFRGWSARTEFLPVPAVRAKRKEFLSKRNGGADPAKCCTRVQTSATIRGGG
jgi:hypothetical protein